MDNKSNQASMNMKRVKRMVMVGAGLLASAPMVLAQTAPDPVADATEAITSATTVMESLQTLVIAGVVFGLIISIVKRKGRA